MKIISAVVITAGFLAGADRKTVWDGVYTAEQAARGQTAYMDSCSRCHGEDLGGYRGVLRDERFMQQWREDNLKSLFNRVKTMPPNAPASLKDSAYIDIIAYLLRTNSFPAGSQPLEETSLDRILVEGKEGPQAVPEFSLVEVVGCMVKDAVGQWIVSKSTEPVRTRNPYASSVEELKAAAAKPPGSQTFRILDPSNVPAAVHNADKVKVKGFLIRKPENRINTTSVEVLNGTCVTGARSQPKR